MKTAINIFILISTFVIPLSGQAELTAFSRSGEGRFNRSSQAVFWANPIFFKPAVFFSSTEVNIRANRKWWRNNNRLLLRPFIADGYFVEDINLIDDSYSKQEENTVLKLNPWVKTQSRSSIFSNPGRSSLSSSVQMKTAYIKKFPKTFEFSPNLYTQVAFLSL